MMKTVQMTIDESLLQQVDHTAELLNTTRSAFIREALERAVQQYKIRQLEELDAAGYERIPAQLEETEVWLSEQDWGDEWNVEK